ncbi:MAG: hypothetical protein Q3M30_10500 [Candidatus Electrothrix sp. Rat3]|nr:hypothetical protein [Candidatus Electrothrix rattekaaiensis]
MIYIKSLCPVNSFSPDSQLLGRIYFHLVENKNSDLPFAFLATYATRMGTEGESRHLPLKYALQEYQKDVSSAESRIGGIPRGPGSASRSVWEAAPRPWSA